MRSRIITVVAAFIVLVTAGVASANGDETDSRVDTLFTYGYDAQTQLFFYNTHATASSPLDCTLTGTLGATYGDADEEGTVPVAGLADARGTVTFDATGYDLAEGIAPAEGVVKYSAAGACGISGVAVGSQGHINHGQFMKLFNGIIDMGGRGCLNRWLAKSAFGKDDQQVTTQVFTEAEVGAEGTIDFTTVEATCNHGNQDKAEDHPGQGHHKDESAATDDGHGRPDAPGKSDKAPGRNKDS